MVPEAGLEPAQLAPLPPQGSVSTNSTTTAAVTHSSRITPKKKELNKFIRQFLVQLVKFHSNLPALWLLFVPILSYRHQWFAFWQTPLNLGS